MREKDLLNFKNINELKEVMKVSSKKISIVELQKLIKEGWEITYISQCFDSINLTLKKEKSFFDMHVKTDTESFLLFINSGLRNSEFRTYERSITLSIFKS